MRGSSEKENEAKPPKAATRRSSAVGFGAREKAPSKDGTVQRHAKDVEGLKDFVSLALHQSVGARVAAGRRMAPRLAERVYVYSKSRGHDGIVKQSVSDIDIALPSCRFNAC